MRRTAGPALPILLVLACSAPARADMLPSPAEQLLNYSTAIRGAGQPCPNVVRSRQPTQQEINANKALAGPGSLVECDNGARYHVVLPPRGPLFSPPGQPRPPPPPPPKVVRLR